MNNLIRMVYVSTTTNPVSPNSSNVPSDVGRILMQSRKNNPADQIGGVLYFSNNFFFQCLEGDQQAVDHLYRKIGQDPRHTSMQTLTVKRVDQRLFTGWSMKYVALDHQVKRLLVEHGFNTFDPCKFDEALINQILGLFVQARDNTNAPDQGLQQERENPAVGNWRGPQASERRLKRRPGARWRFSSASCSTI